MLWKNRFADKFVARLICACIASLLIVLTISLYFNGKTNPRNNESFLIGRSHNIAVEKYITVPQNHGLSKTLEETGSSSFVPSSLGKAEKICFSRGDYIYLMNRKTGRTERITKGSDPNLSPDGSTIAFVYPLDGPYGYERTIKVINLQTGQIKEFPSLTELNPHSPRWSPDGSKFAFSYVKGSDWHIGILNPVNGEWYTLTKNLTDPTGIYLDSWLADGKSLIWHSLTHLYEMNLEAMILQQFPLEKFAHQHYISGGMRFSFSPDRRYLLFNNSSNPDENTAIMMFDFEKDSLLRITPEAIDGREPQWLPSGKGILFEEITRKRGKGYIFNVAKISLDGSNFDVLIRNAESASYSTQ